MVTILGTGNMARGIGTRLLAAGADVTLLGTQAAKAEALAAELRGAASGGAAVKSGVVGDPIADEIIVLAVPYAAAGSLLQRYATQLGGRTVVDITNPLNATYDGLVTPPGSSAAEELAHVVPEATLVKAFNTTFAQTLVAGQVAGQPLDVFLAGDDAAAKARLAQLVQAGGMRPIDACPLQRARQLEALGLLHITLQSTLGTGFASAVKILP